MNNELAELIDSSRFYGANNEYVIAGGGNTSYKNETHIWVKASGVALSTINADGFVCLLRSELKKIAEKQYSTNPVLREEEVKADLYKGIVSTNGKRPSVETSLHEIIDYPFVVHTHPTLVNALMCAKNAKETVSKLFGQTSIFVEYTDPGYILFKKVEERIQQYTSSYKKAPKIIFLENHGVFVAGNSTGEIKDVYNEITSVLKKQLVQQLLDIKLNIQISAPLQNTANTIRQIYKKTILAANSELISYFAENKHNYAEISLPFNPDEIVYCKSKYLFGETENELLAAIPEFEKANVYLPRILLLRGEGLLCMDDSPKNAQTVQDVFIDAMKVSYLSKNFGGQQFMTPTQIAFIDNWEVENYRRKVAREEK